MSWKNYGILFTFWCLLMFFVGAQVYVRGDDSTTCEQTLYPIVRVETPNSMGSGVVLYSDDREQKGRFDTFILTNSHIIEDQTDIKVMFFCWENCEIRSGSSSPAFVFAKSETEDLVLLVLLDTSKYDFPATLAPEGHRPKVFDEVRKSGCALGNATLCTRGEISGSPRALDNKIFIPFNAPMIMGDSGGGVFQKIGSRWCLIGTPARITGLQIGVVPHLAWAIPVSRIYDFIHEKNLVFLVDPTQTPEAARKER